MMRFFLLFMIPVCTFASTMKLGVDCFFEEKMDKQLHGKRIGLITNHTGVDSQLRSTVELFYASTHAKLEAIFTPEHGLGGSAYAEENVKHQKIGAIPVISLHGEVKRPTKEMLSKIDVLIYDIQEIGCRSYTYMTTLFFAMEEAAKKGIEVIVLDRPNPMGGLIDGPRLEEKWRSFLGYVDIPYCHGMTIGELAQYFNEEYKIGCKLKVIPMKGWNRSMTFQDTQLQWIPTSPYIPEPDTPFYYASTGILGALSLVNIGIGYTLPFKIVGAPWIESKRFAHTLNQQNLPGVRFIPFYFRPFYGKFKGEDCQGVKIIITDPQNYRPLSVQYMLIGLLKTMYPEQFSKAIESLSPLQKRLFCQVMGTDKLLHLFNTEKYIAWKLIDLGEKEKRSFLEVRKQYLLY